jgi:hypothetical protein
VEINVASNDLILLNQKIYDFCPGITWAVIDSLQPRKAETQRKRALNRSLKIIFTRKKRNRKDKNCNFYGLLTYFFDGLTGY